MCTGVIACGSHGSDQRAADADAVASGGADGACADPVGAGSDAPGRLPQGLVARRAGRDDNAWLAGKDAPAEEELDRAMPSGVLTSLKFQLRYSEDSILGILFQGFWRFKFVKHLEEDKGAAVRSSADEFIAMYEKRSMAEKAEKFARGESLNDEFSSAPNDGFQLALAGDFSRAVSRLLRDAPATLVERLVIILRCIL